MNPEIIYNIQEGPFWDWRVALDLFLGGAGVGALFFAVYIDEFFHRKYRRIGQTAAWLAPVLVSAGLALVLLKMGRPFHLFLTYTTVNWTAPLWWGGIFQPLLVIGAGLYAWRWSQADDRKGAGWLGRALLPVGLIVGTYHGLLLSVMNARPLWDAGPTVVTALLGFMTTGIAIVMLVHLVRMKIGGRLVGDDHQREFLADMTKVRNTLGVLLVLQLGTIFLWWLSLLFGGLDSREALAAANQSHGPMMWIAGIGIGLVLPILIGGWSLARGHTVSPRQQVSVILLTSVLILVGGYCFRLALLMAGQAELPLQPLS